MPLFLKRQCDRTLGARREPAGRRGLRGHLGRGGPAAAGGGVRPRGAVLSDLRNRTVSNTIVLIFVFGVRHSRAHY